MNDIERVVRSIEADGLVWGACKGYQFGIGYQFFFGLLAKLVPVGYGINKLQIACVVEDDKVDLCATVVVTMVTMLIDWH